MVESSSLKTQQRVQEKWHRSSETSEPTGSPRRAHLLNFPKQFHQLRSKYANNLRGGNSHQDSSSLHISVKREARENKCMAFYQQLSNRDQNLL